MDDVAKELQGDFVARSQQLFANRHFGLIWTQ
jgi:hypothetical protein